MSNININVKGAAYIIIPLTVIYFIKAVKEIIFKYIEAGNKDSVDIEDGAEDDEGFITVKDPKYSVVADYPNIKNTGK